MAAFFAQLLEVKKHAVLKRKKMWPWWQDENKIRHEEESQGYRDRIIAEN